MLFRSVSKVLKDGYRTIDIMSDGKTQIDTVGINAPIIGGESHVYGEVRGNIYIKGDVFPWDIFDNHMKDMFLYKKGKWSAFAIPEKLKPPESYRKRQIKKKNQPER